MARRSKYVGDVVADAAAARAVVNARPRRLLERTSVGHRQRNVSWRVVGKIGIDATAKPHRGETDFTEAFPLNWGDVKLEDYLS